MDFPSAILDEPKEWARPLGSARIMAFTNENGALTSKNGG
jgi:hypothetical protein